MFMGKTTPSVRFIDRNDFFFWAVGVAALLFSLPSFAGMPGVFWISGDYTNPVGVTVNSFNDNGVQANGAVGTLSNSGTIASTRTGFISDWTNGSGVYNGGTIGAIVNKASGIIRSAQFDGIANAYGGTIASINNAGLLMGGAARPVYGIYNADGFGGNTMGTAIGSITNTGTIVTGEAGQGFGIFNSGTIHTLNNAQGAGNPGGALTYTGNLPTNYNVIVTSLTNYGQLSGNALTGSTAFGIYPGSTLTKGTYSSVLTGFTPGVNVSATSGSFNGTAWNLMLNSGTTWDLVVQNSATNTLRSVELNSAGLASIYGRQAVAYRAALSHDCQVYDKNKMCASVGGRDTYDGSSGNTLAGFVVVGYRPSPTFRLGAFADQSSPASAPSGFAERKNGPMWGAFAKWNMNEDGAGFGIQVSAVSSSSHLNVTRSLLENTESGSGSTRLDGQGYQFRMSYQRPLSNSTDLLGYLGMRYTRINTGAYTENTTDTVTSPLSFGAMAQHNLAAIGGLGLSRSFAEKYTWTASLGFQQRLRYSMSDYQGASNITGLERFDVRMPNAKSLTATAATGLTYALSARERLAISVMWEEQSFATQNALTAFAAYTVGF